MMTLQTLLLLRVPEVLVVLVAAWLGLAPGNFTGTEKDRLCTVAGKGRTRAKSAVPTLHDRVIMMADRALERQPRALGHHRFGKSHRNKRKSA